MTHTECITILQKSTLVILTPSIVVHNFTDLLQTIKPFPEYCSPFNVRGWCIKYRQSLSSSK